MSEITLVVDTSRTILVEVDGGQTLVVEGAPQYELELSVPGVQGPPGPAGPEGPEGPQGPPGGALEETTTFAAPAAVWEATHGIPITPSVYTYDTSDVPITGDVSYPTPTTVRVEWAWPMAGRLVVTT